MWPFTKREKKPLPDWWFVSVTESPTDVQLRLGEWIITDGAWPKDGFVAAGVITEPSSSISLAISEDGLESVSLEYVATDVPTDACDSCIVIDSGSICLYTGQDFAAAGIDRHLAYRLSMAVYKADKRAKAVLIQEPSGQAVGVVIYPPNGDGTYAIANRDNNGLLAVMNSL